MDRGGAECRKGGRGTLRWGHKDDCSGHLLPFCIRRSGSGLGFVILLSWGRARGGVHTKEQKKRRGRGRQRPPPKQHAAPNRRPRPERDPSQSAPTFERGSNKQFRMCDSLTFYSIGFGNRFCHLVFWRSNPRIVRQSLCAPDSEDSNARHSPTQRSSSGATTRLDSSLPPHYVRGTKARDFIDGGRMHDRWMGFCKRTASCQAPAADLRLFGSFLSPKDEATLS